MTIGNRLTSRTEAATDGEATLREIAELRDLLERTNADHEILYAKMKEHLEREKRRCFYGGFLARNQKNWNWVEAYCAFERGRGNGP